MRAADNAAHGQKSKAVSFCPSALGHRPKRPLPSMLRQYRRLASGGERLRWGGPPQAVGSPVRLHCTAAWSRPGGAPFLRTAGRSAPLGAAAPGARSVSVGRAAPGCGSSRSSPRLRPGARSAGRLGFPSPAGPRLCGRWARPRGFGLQGGRGCAPLWRSAPSAGFRSLRLLPPPPVAAALQPPFSLTEVT